MTGERESQTAALAGTAGGAPPCRLTGGSHRGRLRAARTVSEGESTREGEARSVIWLTEQAIPAPAPAATAARTRTALSWWGGRGREKVAL